MKLKNNFLKIIIYVNLITCNIDIITAAAISPEEKSEILKSFSSWQLSKQQCAFCQIIPGSTFQDLLEELAQEGTPDDMNKDILRIIIKDELDNERDNGSHFNFFPISLVDPRIIYNLAYEKYDEIAKKWKEKIAKDALKKNKIKGTSAIIQEFLAEPILRETADYLNAKMFPTTHMIKAGSTTVADCLHLIANLIIADPSFKKEIEKGKIEPMFDLYLAMHRQFFSKDQNKLLTYFNPLPKAQIITDKVLENELNKILKDLEQVPKEQTNPAAAAPAPVPSPTAGVKEQPVF